MQIPDHVILCREEFERQVKNGLKDIEEKNEILKGLNSLKAWENVIGVKLSRRVSKKRRLRLTKLKQVRRRCDELRQEYWERWRAAKRKGSHVDRDELEIEYEYKIRDYLQIQLNVSFNTKERNAVRKELGDVIFHYLMRGEKPDGHAQKLIHRLRSPLYDHTLKQNNYNWLELCCNALQVKDIFSQFYERFSNSTTAIEYLLYTQPQLLLNKRSDVLVDRLIQHACLPFEKLHQILTNIRDKNGRTHMFHTRLYSLFAEVYADHVDDLYELLSIQDINGQTVLHVNTSDFTYLLADAYTPKQQTAFIKLTSIRDQNNRTALQVAERWDREALASLIHRAEENEYILWAEHDTNILIICNTKNRSGAEEEAQTIHDAFMLKFNTDNITFVLDKNESQMVELVRHTANSQTFVLEPLKSLLVVLSSHGSIGTIDDCDGKPIQLSVIEEAMCSKLMEGKPKMLLTQCCQHTTKEVDDKLMAYSPTHAHFCAIMSCVSGEKSKRGVFLVKLSEQIRNSSKETNIFKLISRVRTEMEKEQHKQTPIIMSTLKAEFCPTDDWHG